MRLAELEEQEKKLEVATKALTLLEHINASSISAEYKQKIAGIVTATTNKEHYHLDLLAADVKLENIPASESASNPKPLENFL